MMEISSRSLRYPAVNCLWGLVCSAAARRESRYSLLYKDNISYNNIYIIKTLVFLYSHSDRMYDNLILDVHTMSIWFCL
jgi:hypothetical protein